MLLCFVRHVDWIPAERDFGDHMIDTDLPVARFVSSPIVINVQARSQAECCHCIHFTAVPAILEEKNAQKQLWEYCPHNICTTGYSAEI